MKAEQAIESRGMSGANEKRRTKRRREETLVRFDGNNFSIYSRAVNLSESGAFLATHYLLDPGTQIELHLFDSVGQESVTSARVVRAMTSGSGRGEATIGLGVEFISVEDANIIAM